ncbi:MAG: DUF2309 domain-containing protein, partial [Sneathiella sp.]|nr:DUF2309 domain-containing protein [Sneathiella sp.]
MEKLTTPHEIEINACEQAVEQAIRSIPPVWPLSSSVAVNPYLGQVTESLEATGARLGRVAGIRVTMPRKWYADRVHAGIIQDEDLELALTGTMAQMKPSIVETLKKAMMVESPMPKALPTIAEIATPALGVECAEFVVERIGFWAAGYFDRGQALWSASKDGGAYSQWRAFATRDLTPGIIGIIGIKGFAHYVDQAPETALGAIARSVDILGLKPNELPTYFHTLLITLGGWAQLGRYELWQAELQGDTNSTLIDLLAIRLLWEEALFVMCRGDVAPEWQKVRAAHAAPLTPSYDLVIDTILQEASDLSEQRRLGTLLSSSEEEKTPEQPDLIAAFCIDVRSEPYRRALEGVHPGIKTIGFAGFFGLPSSHQGFASDVKEHRLPVLLNPSLHSHSGDAPLKDQNARFLARAKRAWGRFKLAAVSSFAFVEAAGPIYAGKLVADALGWAGTQKSKGGACPVLDPMPELNTRVEMAANILNAMSLKEFAPIILLVGHGANVVNNPHASALHCGACGGYSGEVNAQLLAAMLNDPEVRAGLYERGIQIPEQTRFVAALHDTTTDQVSMFDEDLHGFDDNGRLLKVENWLKSAGKIASTERAIKLPRAHAQKDIIKRSKDWSEIRPEWALAGCTSFIAAPRHRTAGKNLEGRAFLHEYNWQEDEEFSVLELIMTAPVVVASWISLQYYGSTVSPEVFGGGNKLLHNVIGGIGVVEGNGGILRAGLPWQSVHDGNEFIHTPTRLSVCIEAPRDAMTAILEKHEDVRALFDNRWLHLIAL